MIDTKDMILKTALHLFAKEGYEAVSVSMIAGKLGMTKGALYKHYKNKRDIFDCIVAKMQENDTEAAENFSMPNGNAECVSVEQLSLFALSQFEYWTQDEFASDFRKLLTIEQYRSGEMQRLYQQYIADGQLSYVEEIFTALEITDARKKAFEFFSPMYLCYSLADKGENISELIEYLSRHFNNFNLK